MIENQDIKEFEDYVNNHDSRKILRNLYCKKTQKGFVFIDILKSVTDHFLNDVVSDRERLYVFLSDLSSLPKCYCGKKTVFKSIKDGYRKYCSTKCMVNSSEVIEKIKLTNVKKYGFDHAMKAKVTREKVKKTNIERIGVDNPLKSKEVKDKIKQTNKKKFGFEYSIQSKEVRNNIKNTCQNKYGVDNVFELEEVKDKIKQTNLNKYGVDNPLKSKEIQEQIKQTNLERYGVENPFGSKEIQEQIKQTNLERYGVEYIFQSKEIQEQIKQTNLERYGVDCVLTLDSVKKQSKMSHRLNFFNRLLNSDRLKNLCKPNFDIDKYDVVSDTYEWMCCKCNTIFKDNIEDGKIPRCSNCFPRTHGTSVGEKEIYNFCKQYFDNVIQNDRKILDGLEIDVLIPEINLGIEFNGLYWHSEIGGNKSPKYHYNKTLKAKEKGIQLIQIFEDEWYFKQDIVKSILLSKMGKIKNRVFARKCSVVMIDNNIAKNFYFDNHLQDYISGIHIGLMYNGDLVSLMTFGKPRFNKKYEYEILRFCSKTYYSIVGGLSKLLSYFIKNYKPESIMSYIDARYGTGKGYLNCEFKLKESTGAGYHYVVDNYGQRESRIKYQKHKLPNILKVFDPNLTEWENMQLNGFDRIWDCGNNVVAFKNFDFLPVGAVCI